MSKDVVYVCNCDWEAVYIDGELISQGHSVNWMNVVESLGCNIYNMQAKEDWLQEVGYFPENISEVEFDE